MAIEFHGEPGGVDVSIGGIEIPGVFRAEESGEGLHEEYKAEVEERSGGSDSAEEPPAARINIEAYVRQETFEELNELRQTRDPFEVGIGPFAFEQMGIVDLDLSVDAEETNSKHLRVQLQEYREQIVQQRSLSDEGSGTGSTGGSGDLDASGPAAAWVDKEGDGRDDNTGEPIPDMQTIPVASGQQVIENVGSGEGFGRVKFDIASGGRPQINTNGGNWAVQDVGFGGPAPTTPWTNMNVTATGGECLVRNVYMGEGAPMYTGSTGGTGFWVDPASSGTLIFEYINVQNFPDNGIYASAPKGGMTCIIRDSYARNNGVSQYRLANGAVQNCVAVLDGGHGGHGGRCVWVWAPGPVEIEDSQLLGGSMGYGIITGANNDPGGPANATNTAVTGGTREGSAPINVSNEASTDPNAYHENIPGSATDAAAGLSGSSDTSGGEVQ